MSNAPAAAPSRQIVTAEPADVPEKPAFGFTAEEAADMKAKYNRIGSLRGGRGVDGNPAYQLILRAPKRAESKRYRAQIHEPARRSEAQEALGRAIVVGVWWKGEKHIGEAKARLALDEVLEDYTLALDSSAASEVIESLVSGAVADEEKG